MSLLNSLVTPFTRSSSAACAEDSATDTSTRKPRYEVQETADAFALVVNLPGVARDGLEITAEDDVVRVVGRPAWKQPEGWTPLYRESAQVPYELALTHDHAVDLDKVQAELKDGVLRVTLPKTEAVKPRKIAVA